jgi:hypothetical protein
METTPTTPKPSTSNQHTLRCCAQVDLMPVAFTYRSVLIEKKIKKGAVVWQFKNQPKDQRKRVTHSFSTPQECTPVIDAFLDWTHSTADGVQVNWTVRASIITTFDI